MTDTKEMAPGGFEGDSRSTGSDNAKDSSDRLDSESPISYLYFTFNTELPTPATGLVDRSTALPECPDLKPYISPFEWGPARKTTLLTLTCIATFLTSYCAGAYSPPARLMAADFHASRTVVLVGITMFCLGFGMAPMAVAPLSEVSGRYPVFVVSGILYVIFQIACAVMPNVGGELVARFFVGVGGSVFSSVVGGVIADMWGKEGRNTPMALFSGCVLAGTGAGPLGTAALVHNISDPTKAWKWSFWHQVIMSAAAIILLVIFFKESRGSVLLSRKAKVLNKWYEELEQTGVYGVWMKDDAAVQSTTQSFSSTSQIDNSVPLHGYKSSSQLRRIRWVVKEDEMRPTLLTMVSTSVRRPFHMLFTEPVVFAFSLWAAFSWGVLFLSFSVVPFLYGTDFDRSSRVYVSMMVASTVATVVGIFQDRLLKHPQWRARGPDEAPYTNSKFWAFMRRKFPPDSPEARLYFTCITALFLPAGLFGAFLSPSYMDEYSRAVGLGFATWGIFSVYLAAFNYLADAYLIYASSALAAQSMCRNLLAGSFVLATTPMFQNLGIKPAGGLLGAIALLLSAVPWVLVFFGAKIRARSKFSNVSDCNNSIKSYWVIFSN